MQNYLTYRWSTRITQVYMYNGRNSPTIVIAVVTRVTIMFRYSLTSSHSLTSPGDYVLHRAHAANSWQRVLVQHDHTTNETACI